MANTIKIYNTSSQLIRLQLRPPGGEFYSTEQQVGIAPGQVVSLPKSHVLQEQVENLQRRQMLRVLYDSEK
jgi:hypothetical protein